MNNQALKNLFNLFNEREEIILHSKKVNTSISTKCMMKVTLILRFAILICIFLGGLLAIIATAGKEWQKLGIEQIGYHKTRTDTLGLWEHCVKVTTHILQFSQVKQEETTCQSINDFLDLLKEFVENTRELEGNSFFN